MSLESLGNFFDSTRNKGTLQKAQLSYELAKTVKEVVNEEVKVILRKSTVVLECPNEACAAALKLHWRLLDKKVANILGPGSKLRITSQRQA